MQRKLGNTHQPHTSQNQIHMTLLLPNNKMSTVPQGFPSSCYEATNHPYFDYHLIFKSTCRRKIKWQFVNMLVTGAIFIICVILLSESNGKCNSECLPICLSKMPMSLRDQPLALTGSERFLMLCVLHEAGARLRRLTWFQHQC